MILCCAESSKNHKTPADVVGLEVGEAVGERVGQALQVLRQTALIWGAYVPLAQRDASWEQDMGLPFALNPVVVKSAQIPGQDLQSFGQATRTLAPCVMSAQRDASWEQDAGLPFCDRPVTILSTQPPARMVVRAL